MKLTITINKETKRATIKNGIYQEIYSSLESVKPLVSDIGSFESIKDWFKDKMMGNLFGHNEDPLEVTADMLSEVELSFEEEIQTPTKSEGFFKYSYNALTEVEAEILWAEAQSEEIIEAVKKETQKSLMGFEKSELTRDEISDYIFNENDFAQKYSETSFINDLRDIQHEIINNFADKHALNN